MKVKSVKGSSINKNKFTLNIKFLWKEFQSKKYIGYNYIGCYQNQNNVDLAVLIYESTFMTVDVCSEICFQKDFKYAEIKEGYFDLN